MDLGLCGRVALVTGSSRGIGRAIAEQFGREGSRVVVTYCHDRDRAEDTAAAVRAAGGESMVLHLDLAVDRTVREACAAVLARWTRIDILVNNAVQWGSYRVAEAPPFECVEPDEWRTQIRVNVEGVYAAMQAVLPSMRARKWGRIVTISAAAAERGMRGAGWYSACKLALHGLTRSLANEVGADGVLANVVMPGVTLTEKAGANLSAAALSSYARSTALERLPTPEEVALPVLFLASAANTVITGEVLRVTGGLVVPIRPVSTRPEVAVPADRGAAQGFL